MKISTIVMIHLNAVTLMVIDPVVLKSLSLLKRTADSAEKRLTTALESKVQNGIIQVIPCLRRDY